MSYSLYTLYKSKNNGKKYDVYVVNPETQRINKVSFGAKGYSDYTIHRDKDRRERYRTRHFKDSKTDYTKPGFWSWHILWGDSVDLYKNMKRTLKKYIGVK